MKILHIGNLCNNSFKLARFQRALGADARLRLEEVQIGTNDDPAWEDTAFSNGYPDWIEVRSASRSSVLSRMGKIVRAITVGAPKIKGIDILHAQCTAPIEAQFRAPEYFVAHCLGSDLRELAFSHTLYGYLLRRAYRKARIIYFNNIDHIDYLERLGLEGHFLPNPLDLDRIHPTPPSIRFHGYDFVIFHPTAHDWTYHGSSRSSTKGNDRLIRAFARFLNDRPHALLVMIRSGIDITATETLIQELRIGDNVKLVERLSKTDLINYLNSADVVADQFDVGAFGGTAIETLACAKPLITYLKEDPARRCYGDIPPIFNGRTVDQIEIALRKSADCDRQVRGAASRAWTERHHHWKHVVENVLAQYETVLAGGAVVA